jgi:hypothetical protein
MALAVLLVTAMRVSRWLFVGLTFSLATLCWAQEPSAQNVSRPGTERSPNHVEIAEAMLADSTLSHVSFDISWDEVATHRGRLERREALRVATMLNRYPDRFLFGTDTVAPTAPAPYFAVFDMWAPVFQSLTPEASLKVRKENYHQHSVNVGKEDSSD